MDSVHVCHINTRFLKGGGTKNTLLTIAGLDKSRYEIDLVVGRDVYRPQVENVADVNLIVVESMVRDIHPFLDLSTLIALYRLFRRNRYHIVHTHIAKAGVLGRIAAKLTGVPVVVHSLHGSTFHSGLGPFRRCLYVLLEKLAGSATDCFVTVGEDLRDRYIAQGIGDSEKYVVIHSGMDLSQFFAAGKLPAAAIQAKRAELGMGSNDAVVGMVGSLEPRKGHLYLIEAAEEVTRARSNVRFLFVGEGFYQEELERAVRSRGLRDHIVFTGYRTDIAEVIAALDVLALTSLWEGLPQVLVQAAAVGKPIVTFDVEGAREVVEDGVNGFVVPLKDAARLVEKLDYLLSDLDRAQRMGLRGRDFVDDSWSVETMVQQTDALYQRLLRVRGLI